MDSANLLELHSMLQRERKVIAAPTETAAKRAIKDVARDAKIVVRASPDPLAAPFPEFVLPPALADNGAVKATLDRAYADLIETFGRAVREAHERDDEDVLPLL